MIQRKKLEIVSSVSYMFLSILTLSSTLKPETLIKKNRTDEKVLKQRAADKATRKVVCIIT